MEEKKEMSLIEKRAKLIEYQNQISWITSEYSQIKKDSDNFTRKYDTDSIAIMYENLANIIIQIKDEELDKYLSPIYKKTINGLMASLEVNSQHYSEL